MTVQRREVVWAVLGSLVISSGITITALSAFDNQFRLVMLGLLVFIFGYWLSQRGVQTSGKASENQGNIFETLIYGSCVVVGWAGLSYGITMWAQTVLEPGFWSGFFSGLYTMGGYTIAHIGINKAGLGQWLYELDRLRSGTPKQYSDSSLKIVSENRQTVRKQFVGNLIKESHRWNWTLLSLGFIMTIVPLGSGAIWACGDRCLSDQVVWAESRHFILVFVAGLLTWWGYLISHYAVSGRLIGRVAKPSRVE